MSITIKFSENALDTWCERGYFCRKHECAWWMDEWCELASRLTPVAGDEAEADAGEDESSTRAAGEHDR